ncbi:hypothetical protein WK39_15435 [Burkholderia cepacia]|nr:hypothetical protein WK40_22370 [Burkholderia cepacia]KVS60870.1 hypothetical protein WK39_15435 [Burkholderia cepacia]
MQCVGFRIAQDAQDTVHEHVRLGQTLFRSAKSREVARTDHHACIGALDVNIGTIKLFSDYRLATQTLDEQFA